MIPDTQADEYLQEQLVEQGDVSSMRYIGDDYTRIVTTREDRLLNIITAYTNKQIEAVLDRLAIEVRASDYIGIAETIQSERNKLTMANSPQLDKLKERDDE